jgi:Ribosomal S13/S15 N-terminal domain
VEESIYKFAKKGMTPSQIGVILRDSHGIAQVRSVTGSKILRILKAHGMVLYFFILFLKLFVFGIVSTRVKITM